MNILFYIANGLVLPPAIHFSINYQIDNSKKVNYTRLPITKTIIAVTVLVTTLQFIFPAIIPVLDRNKDALFAGEIWRLITPLFIQPMGVWQCVFNGIFFIVFMPVAEHFYGRKLILIYFIALLDVQIDKF